MADEFPTTTWGLLRQLRDPASPEYRAGLETLCERYREPIRRYAGRAWATRDRDEQDITQDFFLWILEKKVLAGYEPGRGSFRLFLKGLLRNFGRNARQAARALKRGGGIAPVSLDSSVEPEDPRTRDAESAFDLAWINEVTRRAVARVRERLSKKRAVQWRVFEEYDLREPDARPTYGDVARALGLTESDVRNHLHAVRSKVRDAIREELCDTVATRHELESELRVVLAS